MVFIAQNMGREYSVKKDPRTWSDSVRSAGELQIAEARAAAAARRGRVGSIRRVSYWILRTGPQADWNLRVFWLLYELFQLTVRPSSEVPAPGTTIAK